MQQIILILHILVAAAIIGLVLLQKSSAGSGLGSAFGSGASGTLFGSQGSMSFLFKLTAVLVLVFFSTSIILARMATDSVRHLSAPAGKSKVLPKLPVQDNVPIHLKGLGGQQKKDVQQKKK